ncbi:hypothetical protein C2845_PM11G20920 [Panicum miliaceum]|uniref:Uncharacterized protein n=1 Tax=Panicum miliaceum TaxID=4540 RepID=A0A3L6RS14_PANMI|nr:hypothetical protein C2845_PM11G20920 [Panicum miliaceum]
MLALEGEIGGYVFLGGVLPAAGGRGDAAAAGPRGRRLLRCHDGTREGVAAHLLTLKYTLRQGANASLQSQLRDPTTGALSTAALLASGLGAHRPRRGAPRRHPLQGRQDPTAAATPAGTGEGLPGRGGGVRGAGGGALAPPRGFWFVDSWPATAIPFSLVLAPRPPSPLFPGLDSIHRNPLLLKPAQAQAWGRGGEGSSSILLLPRAHSLRTRSLLLLLEEAVVLSRHRKEEVVEGTRGAVESAHLLFTRPTTSSQGVALESIRAGDMLAVELERGRNSTHVLVLLRVGTGHPQDHQAL